MAKTELSEKESLLVHQVVEAVQRGARLDDSIKRALRGITTDGGRYSYLWGKLSREATRELKRKKKVTPQPATITPLMKLEAEIHDRDTPPSSR